MAFQKSIAFLALSFGVARSLAPGDCAFVGIYGEKDDFAILLTEDADGEKLSLTDGRFQDKDYVSSQRAHAKSHVKDAVQGTILRKSDFQTEDSWSFAAPLALTVFKGTSSSPTALCGLVWLKMTSYFPQKRSVNPLLRQNTHNHTQSVFVRVL